MYQGRAGGTPADGSITNAKLANMATQRIKGRTTAGTGVPEDLTPVQAFNLLGLNAAFDSRCCYIRDAKPNGQGDDTTAIIGNPLRPFATLQAAADAVKLTFNTDAVVVDMGYGLFAGLNLNRTLGLYIRGVGLYSEIGDISTNGFPCQIYDVGFYSVIFNDINSEKAGAVPGIMDLYNLWCRGDILCRGADDVTGFQGGDIRLNWNLYLDDSTGGGRVLYSGGASSADDTNGAPGGSMSMGGDIHIEGAINGAGGDPGPDNGGSPVAGANGTLTVNGAGMPNYPVPTGVDQTFISPATVGGVFVIPP